MKKNIEEIIFRYIELSLSHGDEAGNQLIMSKASEIIGIIDCILNMYYKDELNELRKAKKDSQKLRKQVKYNQTDIEKEKKLHPVLFEGDEQNIYLKYRRRKLLALNYINDQIKRRKIFNKTSVDFSKVSIYDTTDEGIIKKAVYDFIDLKELLQANHQMIIRATYIAWKYILAHPLQGMGKSKNLSKGRPATYPQIILKCLEQMEDGQPTIKKELIYEIIPDERRKDYPSIDSIYHYISKHLSKKYREGFTKQEIISDLKNHIK